MSSRQENNKEFVAIRDEFMTIMKDVNKDAEMDVAYRDAVDELDHAYNELDRLYNKLQKEKTQRARLEQDLLDLKHAHNSNVDVASREIEKKNQQVAAAKADRDAMKEWLDRGVSECKKVSDDVIQLRKDLQLSEDNCAQLARDKNQLTAHLKRLHEDLEKMRRSETDLHTERTELAGQLEHKKMNLETVTQRHREAEARENALRAEVGDLMGRVNRLGECERCLIDLVRELEAAANRVKDLDEGLSSGRLFSEGAAGGNGPASMAVQNSFSNRVGALTDAPGVVRSNTINSTVGSSFDLSAQRGDGGGPSVADTRALLHLLHNNVEHLNETVFRFIRGKQRTFDEVQRIQQNEISALQRDKMSLLAKHEVEKEELKNRCRDLEKEIVQTALTTDAYTDRAFARFEAHESAAANRGSTIYASQDAAFSIGNVVSAAGLAQTPTPISAAYADESAPPVPRNPSDAERDILFTQLQSAFREYQELSQTIAHLRTENQRVRQKASRRKIDWVKVNDSRTRYQHLVKELEMMKAYQSRLLAENEHLEQIAQMHIEKASQSPAEVAAKKYRFQKEQNLSRMAFDEWKNHQTSIAGGVAKY